MNLKGHDKLSLLLDQSIKTIENSIISYIVWWPSLSVWLTNGNSISGESCDSIGLVVLRILIFFHVNRLMFWHLQINPESLQVC